MCLRVETQSLFGRYHHVEYGGCLLAAKMFKLKFQEDGTWRVSPPYYGGYNGRKYDIQRHSYGVEIKAELYQQDVQFYCVVDGSTECFTAQQDSLGIHSFPLIRWNGKLGWLPISSPPIGLHEKTGHKEVDDLSSIGYYKIVERIDHNIIVPVLIPYNCLQGMGSNGDIVSTHVIVPPHNSYLESAMKSALLPIYDQDHVNEAVVDAWRRYLLKATRRFFYCLSVKHS